MQIQEIEASQSILGVFYTSLTKLPSGKKNHIPKAKGDRLPVPWIFWCFNSCEKIQGWQNMAINGAWRWGIFLPGNATEQIIEAQFWMLSEAKCFLWVFPWKNLWGLTGLYFSWQGVCWFSWDQFIAKYIAIPWILWVFKKILWDFPFCNLPGLCL